jgi:hypothetical protein
MKLTPPRRLRILPKVPIASPAIGAPYGYVLIPSLRSTLIIYLSLHSRVLVAPRTHNSRYEEPARWSVGETLTDDSLEFKNVTSNEERISGFQEDSPLNSSLVRALNLAGETHSTLSADY